MRAGVWGAPGGVVGSWVCIGGGSLLASSRLEFVLLLLVWLVGTVAVLVAMLMVPLVLSSPNSLISLVRGAFGFLVS